jgi:Na+/proline symporter
MNSLKEDFKFDWVEYSTVATMLIFSILVGVYYTFFKKQDTFSEYMLGGKTMGVFPVSMSLVARLVQLTISIHVALNPSTNLVFFTNQVYVNIVASFIYVEH